MQERQRGTLCENSRSSRMGRGCQGWKKKGLCAGAGVIQAPFPAPLPARLQGSHDGDPQRADGGGWVGRGGGPEVPQHPWLKMIPHNALIILRYGIMGGGGVEKEILPGMERARHAMSSPCLWRCERARVCVVQQKNGITAKLRSAPFASPQALKPSWGVCHCRFAAQVVSHH